DIRADVDRVSRKLGRGLTFLVGKPGLDGHSNGGAQIAVRARDTRMQVVYEGIRLTPEEIVDAARKEKAHVVGLSVLSGSHLPLVEDVVGRMKEAGLDGPVIVGGIIPPEDAAELEKAGVAAVYTPKDFELNRILSDVVRIVESANGASNVCSAPAALCQCLSKLSRAHWFYKIEIHPCIARSRFVTAFATAGNSNDRRKACLSRQRADAARRVDAVQTRERDVHQHHVVTAALH